MKDIFGIMDEMYKHGVYEIDILAIFDSLFVGKKDPENVEITAPCNFFCDYNLYLII